MKKLFIFLILFSFCTPCFAVENYFDNGNKYYKDGKYDAAIKAYDEMIKDGWASGALYYNLGNCFFKEQAWGKAILNYERARRFIPRDNELKTNINIARSKISGYAILTKKDLRTYLVELFFKDYTADELFSFIICLYLSLVGIAIACLFVPRLRRGLAFAAGAMFILFVIGNISLYDRMKTIEAIITAPNTLTRFEPFESSTVFFELPQGTKVKVIESQEGWRKIKRSDGKTGWIAQNNIEKI